MHSYAYVEQSVVLPDVNIGRHARIQRAIIDRGCVIPEHMVIGEDHEDVLHDSRGRGVAKLYPRRVRAWDPERPDRPSVHESVLRRSESQSLPGQEEYHPWILGVDHDVADWPRLDDETFREED